MEDANAPPNHLAAQRKDSKFFFEAVKQLFQKRISTTGWIYKLVDPVSGILFSDKEKRAIKPLKEREET